MAQLIVRFALYVPAACPRSVRLDAPRAPRRACPPDCAQQRNRASDAHQVWRRRHRSGAPGGHRRQVLPVHVQRHDGGRVDDSAAVLSALVASCRYIERAAGEWREDGPQPRRKPASCACGASVRARCGRDTASRRRRPFGVVWGLQSCFGAVGTHPGRLRPRWRTQRLRSRRRRRRCWAAWAAAPPARGKSAAAPQLQPRLRRLRPSPSPLRRAGGRVRRRLVRRGRREQQRRAGGAGARRGARGAGGASRRRTQQRGTHAARGSGAA